MITDTNYYYPFGMSFLKTNTSCAGVGIYSNLKCNGKELQETGMYDYGFRQYMPEIGRWNGMDRLSEIYSSSSPYAYVLNNPVMMYDPNGMVTKEWVNSFYDMSQDHGETDYYFDSNGNHGAGQFSSFGSQTDVVNKAYDFIASGGTGSYSYWTWGTPYGNVYGGEAKINVFKISESNYDFNPYQPQSSGLFDDVNWERTNKAIGGFGFGNGIKTELIDFAVRTNYKSARTFSEFNALKSTQQDWRLVNTLGEGGAKYLKFAKGLGAVATVATTVYSTATTISYYYNGGGDWKVGAKYGIDLVMTGVGFLGPIGFGISATYFIVDASTNGLGGFGKIPDN